jgi:hypothetical protein
MRPIGILTILCALTPAMSAADETPRRPEQAQAQAQPQAPAVRRWPNPADLVAPGIIRQDLFDRRNPANLRHDYPPPPRQPGQF